MTLSISELLSRLAEVKSELYLLVCSETVIYDSLNKLVYAPITMHNTAKFNPLGDFRTHIGHGLLWSQQLEIECSSDELNASLYREGYEFSLIQSDWNYGVYTMAKPAEAAVCAPCVKAS